MLQYVSISWLSFETLYWHLTWISVHAQFHLELAFCQKCVSSKFWHVQYFYDKIWLPIPKVQVELNIAFETTIYFVHSYMVSTTDTRFMLSFLMHDSMSKVTCESIKKNETTNILWHHKAIHYRLSCTVCMSISFHYHDECNLLYNMVRYS